MFVDNATTPIASRDTTRSGVKLFLASLAALYFEVLIIRYLSTELLFFAYLKNLPLIASFLGMGLGMILGHSPRRLLALLPPISILLFAALRFAQPLGLAHAIVVSPEYFVWAILTRSPVVLYLEFLVLAAAFISMIVAFFMVLGGLVGEHLNTLGPLQGYGINLAGSLAGLVAFTVLAYLDTSPGWWLLLGFSVLLLVLPRRVKYAGGFAITLAIVAIPQTGVYWSPYYRIDLGTPSGPSGWPRTALQELEVNHDYHQRMMDLSADFTARHPDFEPNRAAVPHYELAYRLLPKAPMQVLVVGAGTGNDVAAALRNHVSHVDAVEIDPVIFRIGQDRHPERPYSSPRVTVHIQDARTFFRNATAKYDLIIFGLLDSHTLSSTFSSLRLDNYVFTRESFDQARALLVPNGTMVLAAGSDGGFVTNRLFATLNAAFGSAPRVFRAPYENGWTVEFVQGGAHDAPTPTGVTDITEFVAQGSAREQPATDRWPFVYLAKRAVPSSMLTIFAIFVLLAWKLVRSTVNAPLLTSRASMHFWLLGAGFLLLETKAVTEMSLLFGSTWTVNTVVISSFLIMALLSNVLISFHPIPRRVSYVVLLLILLGQLAVPYSLLTGATGATKVLVAGLTAGLPIFCSGLIFSRSFADVPRPAVALGVNLFGAVVGGLLENVVMIGGTALLGVLAILLYAGSAACSPTSARSTAFPRAASSSVGSA
jgi:hypothetical protein